jgi:hypothetical protein
MKNCIEGSRAPDDCSLELYTRFTENLISIYEEIFALRNGRPTIIRAYGLYNLLISKQRENNIESERTQCFATFNRAIQLAAEEFNIPFVSIYDASACPRPLDDGASWGSAKIIYTIFSRNFQFDTHDYSLISFCRPNMGK